ncbi:MAG: hypothetical protein HY687_03150 [Chloroflexi bacterium]|nr:hypothetical protein [Chloroflexota bacterium]
MRENGIPGSKGKFGGGPAWGLWAWVLQRLTAAVVVVTIIMHLWLTHWAQAGREISFDEVSRRLQSPLFVAVDVLLLGAALYHALYGVRGILWELGLGPQAPRLFLAFYGLVGLSAFIYGLNALLPFVFKISFF